MFRTVFFLPFFFCASAAILAAIAPPTTGDSPQVTTNKVVNSNQIQTKVPYQFFHKKLSSEPVACVPFHQGAIDVFRDESSPGQ